MSSNIRQGPLPVAATDGELHPGELRPASAFSEIQPGPLDAAPDDAEIHPGPLHRNLAGAIHAGPLEPASADPEIHRGPLPRAGEEDVRPSSLDDLRAERNTASPVRRARDWRAGLSTFATLAKTVLPHRSAAAPSDPVAPISPKYKKTWREQRWERRRKRLMFEEVLGWVLVPVILIGLYIGVKGILSALGTTPTALIQGIQTALSNRSP